MWGSPVYVLDPKLQDGKKLPKWTPRARRGMNVGFLPLHTSTVTRVLNLETGFISPQYHYVCDDNFSTVINTSVDPDRMDPTQWSSLIKNGYENHLDLVDFADFHKNNETWRLPTLNNKWLTLEERRQRNLRRNAQRTKLNKIQHEKL